MEVEDIHVLGNLTQMLGEKWTGMYHQNRSIPDTAVLTRHDIHRHSYAFTGNGMGIRILVDSTYFVNVWSMHLDYLAYGPYAAFNKLVTSVDQILAGENPRSRHGRAENMEELKNNSRMIAWRRKSQLVPVIVAGDFNCPSHLDWTDAYKKLKTFTFLIHRHSYAFTGNGMGIRILVDSTYFVNVWSMHLDYIAYGPYAAFNKLVTSVDQILAGENPRSRHGRAENMEELKNNSRMIAWRRKSQLVPVIVAGDFNCPSHLDWTDAYKDRHGDWAVQWPATKAMEDMKFIDSFREVHPDVDLEPGTFWTLSYSLTLFFKQA
ncbi:hypothetical protein OESDEN_02399 [Oesophagostomum dentatum]|uniref:Endonuclease/exonuclease/phosphatase domain-containing protein n=1 Tax=Oesophagostomum dentatum TaxID=61180 RepID=A0A0B1TQH0_OESDE|nr:hypothetical protein OESDEN_02399 [Oesophagostomum dentatum]